MTHVFLLNSVEDCEYAAVSELVPVCEMVHGVLQELYGRRSIAAISQSSHPLQWKWIA